MEAFKESGDIEYSTDVLIGLQLSGVGQKDFDVNEAKNRLHEKLRRLSSRTVTGPPETRFTMPITQCLTNFWTWIAWKNLRDSLRKHKLK